MGLGLSRYSLPPLTGEGAGMGVVQSVMGVVQSGMRVVQSGMGVVQSVIGVVQSEIGVELPVEADVGRSLRMRLREPQRHCSRHPPPSLPLPQGGREVI